GFYGRGQNGFLVRTWCQNASLTREEPSRLSSEFCRGQREQEPCLLNLSRAQREIATGFPLCFGYSERFRGGWASLCRISQIALVLLQASRNRANLRPWPNNFFAPCVIFRKQDVSAKSTAASARDDLRSDSAKMVNTIAIPAAKPASFRH